MKNETLKRKKQFLSIFFRVKEKFSSYRYINLSFYILNIPNE